MTTIFGPMMNSTPFYQGMTHLPREKEEALLRVPYGALIKFLRSRTVISGTDTVYSAVQWIAREIREVEIDKFLASKDLHQDNGSSPGVATVRAAAPVPSTPRAQAAPRAAADGGKPKPTGHPQPIINAKVAAAKALGGNIAYSRATRAWEAIMPDGTIHAWTAEFFRDTSTEQIEAIMKEHK